jgi:hypothetical protein
LVIDQLAEREGKKGDRRTIEFLEAHYGRDARILAYRILDELLIKEQIISKTVDFSSILTKEIFLKSVLVCAVESVFFISIVKHL